jgi:hypothetical protein
MLFSSLPGSHIWCTGTPYLYQALLFYPYLENIDDTMVSIFVIYHVYIFYFDDQHIIENENFRKVDPERDLKRWEAAESNAHWFSKCKKSTAVVASSTLKLIQPVVPTTVSYSPPRIGGADPVLCHCQAEEWEYQEAQVLE